jgi:hypothetical protein
MRSSGLSRRRCSQAASEVRPVRSTRRAVAITSALGTTRERPSRRRTRTSIGRPLLHGHQLPSPEQIVMEMNRLVSQPLSDELMQGTYGLLSNFVHPTFYALQELFSVSKKDGERTPALDRDITFHERLAQLVVSPFYHALAYVASRMNIPALRGAQPRHHPPAPRHISSPVPAPGRSTGRGNWSGTIVAALAALSPLHRRRSSWVDAGLAGADRVIASAPLDERVLRRG